MDAVWQKRLFWVLAFLLVLYRLVHLEAFIGSPHAWRQTDTAYYIYDFYQNGIDLLYPSVCWMGGHETVIFEFALPEALVALVWKITGESIPVARLIFLSFFLFSAAYAFRLVEFLGSRKLAWWATLVYLTLPLSLYYSRAIHIDFFASACAFAMVFHWLKGLKTKQVQQLWVGTFWAILAFLVKAPYAFVFGLPLLVFTFRENRFFYAFRRMYIFILPVVLFYGWQSHVTAVNASAPDWAYILHYRKFDDNAHWYFGTWQQRLQLTNWLRIKTIVFRESLGWVGVLILVLGLVIRLFPSKVDKPNQQDYGWWLSMLWLGVLLYVAVFFNLNVIHEYYQIPFLLPVSMTLGWAILQLNHLTKPLKFQLLIGGGIIVLIAIESIQYAEQHYYDLTNHEPLIEAGQILQVETEPKDLLIINYFDFDCRNPLVLYRARRRGWQLQRAAFDPPTIYRLHEEAGASHLVLIAPTPPAGEMERFTDAMRNPPQIFPLNREPLKLYLWEIEFPSIKNPSESVSPEGQ
ncbi:MAG: glycosyltransferase family 39 protein [Bacteroidota bacterium]